MGLTPKISIYLIHWGYRVEIYHDAKLAIQAWLELDKYHVWDIWLECLTK